MNKDSSGFTLVELVIVIVLVSILTAYAVVKWPSDSELKLPAQASLLANHIRHTQALAMHWGQPLRLTINAGGYSVSCVTASASAPCNNSPVIDPVTNQAFSVSPESGISLSGANVDFDTLGRPVSGGAIISSTPARTFTLSADGVSQAVVLEPLTGFASL
jgi:MSHA pilin protein MshC